MGQRESYYRCIRVSASSPAAPNAVKEEITVELRVFWPAGSDVAPIEGYIQEVVNEALETLWDSKSDYLTSRAASTAPQ